MCTFCVGNGTLSQLFEEDFLLPHTVYLRRKVKIHEAIIVLMSLLGDVAIMVEYAGTHHPALHALHHPALPAVMESTTVYNSWYQALCTVFWISWVGQW